MSRLKVFYDSLITQRLHTVAPWLKDYITFTKDVSCIRKALQENRTLREVDTYKGTKFEPDGFNAFMRCLLYKKSNGIASRGQSWLREDDFNALIKDQAFLDAVAGLILEPDSEQRFSELTTTWNSITKNNRPLLRNRVLAACTTNVSTTVNEDMFNQVWSWLIDNDLLEKPDPDPCDWRSRNLHLMRCLVRSFHEEIQNQQANVHRLSVFVWKLYENLSNPFNLKPQEISYGAPGTGKTYQAKQVAQVRFEIWQAEHDLDHRRTSEDHIRTVQFHPSYSYEDFIEGFRPVLQNGSSELRLHNGIFKEICIQAGRWELDLLHNDLKDCLGEWENLTIDDLIPHKALLRGYHWDEIFKQAPSTRLGDAIPPWFLIIDEINRAELSRVMGELMLCLDYRGSEGAVQTQYATSNDDQTGMWKTDTGYRFFVPRNVYVIGTMNTIDRSVESFDFALRRRFRWREVLPDPIVLAHHLQEMKQESWLGLVSNMEKLNKSISEERLLGADYAIGHAYLMNLRYSKRLSLAEVRRNIWDDAIHPLLTEYLRGSGRGDELIESFAKAFGIS